jgi:hypothetical protein
MLMSHHQNSSKNNNTKVANESFEYEAKFRYLGMTPTNQNCIHKEIKNILYSGNACCHSVQNLLFQIV